MNKILLTLLLILVPLTANAQWAVVSGQECTINNTDDGICTFPSPVGNGNFVVVTLVGVSQSNTYSITGWSGTINAISGPHDYSGGSGRVHVFCLIGDGVDSTFVGTSSGGSLATVFAQEFTTGTCTQDGTTQTQDTVTTTTHELGTDVTVTGEGSLLISVIRATSSANFNPGSGFVQFGTDALVSAAQYRILTEAGIYDTPWTSSTTETAFMVSLALEGDIAPPPAVDWEVVSGQTCTINLTDDGTCTFPSAVGNGNTVVVGAAINSETQTFSITGWSGTVTSISGPHAHSSGSIDRRIYFVCLTGDGVDTAFVGTSSGNAIAWVFAQEFTGGSCTQDGTTQTFEGTTTPYALPTDVTVTSGNALLISYIVSTSSADFNPGASFVQVGTDALQASMQYRILTTSGDFDTPWTSAANETIIMASLALEAGTPGGGGGPPSESNSALLLVGVGQ